MHRHHVFWRQKIVQYREYRFLHFAGIGRAADENEFALEGDRYDRARCSAMYCRVSLESGKVDDGELGIECLTFASFRFNEQMLNEERMPCVLGNYTNWQAMGPVSAAKKILDKNLAPLGVGAERIQQCVEIRRGHRLVVVPPDVFFDRWFADDEFVSGGAAGVNAGLDNKRAVFGQDAFATLDCLLNQACHRQVPMNLAQVCQSYVVDGAGGCLMSRRVHSSSSPSRPSCGELAEFCGISNLGRTIGGRLIRSNMGCGEEFWRFVKMGEIPRSRLDVQTD